MQDLLLVSNLESSNRDGLEPSQRRLFLNIQMFLEALREFCGLKIALIQVS